MKSIFVATFFHKIWCSFDSIEIEYLRNHGCHCSRLDHAGIGHTLKFHASSPTYDLMDHHCKQWLAARSCTKTLGGSCYGYNAILAVSYESCNEADYNDRCSQDVCSIQNYFFQLVSEELDSVIAAENVDTTSQCIIHSGTQISDNETLTSDSQNNNDGTNSTSSAESNGSISTENEGTGIVTNQTDNNSNSSSSTAGTGDSISTEVDNPNETNYDSVVDSGTSNSTIDIVADLVSNNTNQTENESSSTVGETDASNTIDNGNSNNSNTSSSVSSTSTDNEIESSNTSEARNSTTNLITGADDNNQNNENTNEAGTTSTNSTSDVNSTSTEENDGSNTCTQVKVCHGSAPLLSFEHVCSDAVSVLLEQYQTTHNETTIVETPCHECHFLTNTWRDMGEYSQIGSCEFSDEFIIKYKFRVDEPSIDDWWWLEDDYYLIWRRFNQIGEVFSFRIENLNEEPLFYIDGENVGTSFTPSELSGRYSMKDLTYSAYGPCNASDVTTTTSQQLVSQEVVNEGVQNNPVCIGDEISESTFESFCQDKSAGHYANPCSCKKFIQCDAFGVSFNQKCGPGTLWNQNILNCDWAYNVECNQEVTDEEVENNSVCIGDEISESFFESFCQDKSAGYYSNPCSCKKYIQCDAFGVSFNQKCGPGTLWNQNILNCDWAYNVECSLN